MAGVAVTPINPLSVPRGVRRVDELTGAPATVQCTLHGVTYYYSDAASHSLDFTSILAKIAHLLGDLAQATEQTGTASERAMKAVRAQVLMKEVVSIADATATAHVHAKRFDLAVPAALRCLRTLVSLYGENAVETVPAHLLLAEANLGLGRTESAEGFLSTANYALVKQSKPNHRLRSRLYRNFGRLYAAQGNNTAALEAFSKDIYHSTLCVGPESVDTSIGYFFMAQVFAAQARMEAALAFFDKVVDIWYKHMLGARSAISTALGIDFSVTPPEAFLARFEARAAAIAKGLPPPEADSAHGASMQSRPAGDRPALTEVQMTDALEMLEFISRVRESHLGRRHIATGEVKYTMALILVDCDRSADAVPMLEAARDLFVEHLGADHPSTADVVALLEKVRSGAPHDA